MSDLPGNFFLANPARLAATVCGEVFEPPPPVDLNAWAERHLVAGSESPFPGKYNPARCPFWFSVLEALAPDDPARVISVLASAQTGKTFIGELFIAASSDLDPGSILYVHPTEANAIRFARTKWRPMIRSTPRLGEIFDLRQSKEGGNSTLFQERRDGRGSILIGGASSEASLSMITVKRQVQDDLSKWENNTAGDPEAQADSRSKAFFDAKILKIGTGLLAGSCRITRSFEAGTQNHYHVPCPHCDHEHPLDPDNFIAAIDADQPELAHFSCPSCGGIIEERHRRDIVARGSWVPHHPQAFDQSFTIWAAYAPFETWEQIARGYLAAQGDPASEQTWWNDTGGRAYELPGEAPAWEDLKKRGDAGGRLLGQVPHGALLLTLTLDCQDDYVDGLVCGWGDNLRRWMVARVRVEGHISIPETRRELNRLVEFEWPTSSGTRRKVDLTGIDGGAWVDDVLDWAQGFPKSRVIMVRGVRGDAAPALAVVRRERRPDGRPVKYAGRFFNVGVNSLKGGLYKFLRVERPGQRGFVDFPAGLDDDYYEQLTAEKRTPKIDKAGFMVHAWIKPRGLRNEQLDCYDSETDVLTVEGWRRFSAITANDCLATVNLKTDQIEYHQPSAVIVRDHDGEMLHLAGRRLDIMVTPGHRMVTYRKESATENGKRGWNFDVEPKITLARDLTIHHQIKMTAKWAGKASDTIAIPASHKDGCYTEIEPGRVVDACDWADFLGRYVSEGSRQTHVSKTQGNRRRRVILVQKPGAKLDRIKALVARLPWRWHEDERPGANALICTSKQLFEAVEECGDGAASKRVPAWIKAACPSIIERFVDSAIAGDGWVMQTQRRYATVSALLADDIQELFIKSGVSANITGRKAVPCQISTRNDGLTLDQFHVSECRGPKASLDGGGDGKREFIGKMVAYRGPVYCATVPTGTLICRRNGRAFIAGNCMVYGQALATKLGWRVMTPQHWARLSAAREVEGAHSDLASPNEFWNHEAVPAEAGEVLPIAPSPAPVVATAAVRRVIRSNFMKRRF